MSATLTALAITIVLCVTILAHRWISKSQANRAPLPADPEAVLASRFAKGEIDEAEYAHRLSVIKLGPPLELR